MASVNDPAAEARALLEQMVSAQPDRLPRKMRSAGYRSHEADDLGQEALVRALRSLGGLRGPLDEALLCGWVDTIAANLIRNQRRTLARQPVLQPLEAMEVAGSVADEDPADDLACRASLEELLAHLPDEQRTVFAARVLGERSTAEVAAELDISEDLVRWRLRRARERLRAHLDSLP